MENKKSSALDPNTILTSEYNYIIQTALQANEDRARVTHFYLITVGSLVAAILGFRHDSFTHPYVYQAFAILFLVLAIAGSLTILHLVRLRKTWVESAIAMNKIKNYYIEEDQTSSIQKAFIWTMQTIPPAYKWGSVSFLSALQVAILSSIVFSAFVFFFMLSYDWSCWIPALSGGILFLLFLMLLYILKLKRHDAKGI